jgi:hypothetical protein
MDKATNHVECVADLWRSLPEESLRRKYVALLARAAKETVTVGALENTVQAEALTDWEAAALIRTDPTLSDVAGSRNRINADTEFIVAAGHRCGNDTYRITPTLPLH